MKARDAPEMSRTLSSIDYEVAPSLSSIEDDGPTPKPAPVRPLISTPKRPTATGGRKTPKPKGKATKKPHQPSGYEWRREGAGWDLRKVVWVESATGGKVRKRPYLGHLSKSAFADMKKRHKGKALEQAIAQWIADHDR